TLDGGDDAFRGRRIIRLDDLLPTTSPAPTAPSLDEPPPPRPVGYVWLDPAVAKSLAARLAASIGVLEPNWREPTVERLRAFDASIDAVVAEASSATAPSTSASAPPVFLSLDPGYNAFAAAFGFEPIDLLTSGAVALPINRVDARELLAAAEKHGVGVLFIPVETPPGLVRDLENALGKSLDIETLDAFGSSAARGRSTYVELLRYNLSQLQKALLTP
nr:zinc ABC transporter substrate-binding protein [Chthoniobacterales bacterium]